MTEEDETKRIYCGECGRYTNHSIIVTRKDRGDLNYESRWAEDHRFCQCAGCDSYCYAIESWNEDDWNPHTGEMDSKWMTYPHSVGARKSIADIRKFPPKIRSIYLEIIGAINSQLPVLTAIGLRALIEAICKDQGVKAKNLEKLIDGLASDGILSSSQASILHSHRFLGNVAAHDIESAKPPELVAALEIAESMIRTIYVLPGLSEKIKTGKKPGR